MNDIPPAPPGWSYTIADLMEEAMQGKRMGVGSPEMDWAREYERSLIPADMRFPTTGDVYEAKEDVLVRYMTAWAAPVTGGGQGVLKKGEQVVVKSAGKDSRPISVYADALEYEAVERRLVPPEERNTPKYGGFYLSFKTVELNRKFNLIKAGDGTHG